MWQVRCKVNVKCTATWHFFALIFYFFSLQFKNYPIMSTKRTPFKKISRQRETRPYYRECKPSNIKGKYIYFFSVSGLFLALIFGVPILGSFPLGELGTFFRVGLWQCRKIFHLATTPSSFLLLQLYTLTAFLPYVSRSRVFFVQAAPPLSPAVKDRIFPCLTTIKFERTLWLGRHSPAAQSMIEFHFPLRRL